MIGERTANIICACILLVFSLLMFHELEGLSPEGRIFPEYTLYCLMGASLLLALLSLRLKGTFSVFGKIPVRRWLAIVGLFLAEVFGAMFASFMASMAVGMFIMLLILTPKLTIKSVTGDFLFMAGFMLFFQLFFASLMHIYFPEYIF